MALADKEFEVKADLLDRVDHEGGFKEDGTPKRRPIEHRKGDKVKFTGYEDDEIKHLVELGVIAVPKKAAPTEGSEEEKGGAGPSSGGGAAQ